MRSPADIDALLAQTLVDAHGADETLSAFVEAFHDAVTFPQDAFVAGQPLAVRNVTYDGNERRGLVATCVTRNGAIHPVGLVDVVFPASSEASLYVAAYRKWLGLGPHHEVEDSAATPKRPPLRHKATADDIDLSGPVELIVVSVGATSARCRIPGTERVLTVRCRTWTLVPGTLATIRPRKQWSYAGHPYLSGSVVSCRVDAPALELVPLELRDEGLWDPSEEYWGEEDEPLPEWAVPIVARGPRPLFEMEQVLPGDDPDNPDDDPITRANDYRAAGAHEEAERILAELIETDLRCLDAHAHLGNRVFERWPELALQHYDVGKSIGELSMAEAEDFDGVLDWGFIDNRPYLRCLHGYGLCLWRLGRMSEAAALFERMLWLNPSDNQGVRFLLAEVKAGKSWEDSDV